MRLLILSVFTLLCGAALLHAGQPMAITIERQANRRGVTYFVDVPRVPYNGSSQKLIVHLRIGARPSDHSLPAKVYGSGGTITRSISGKLDGRAFSVPEALVQDLTDLETPKHLTVLQDRARVTIYLYGGTKETRYAAYFDFQDGKLHQRRVTRQ